MTRAESPRAAGPAVRSWRRWSKGLAALAALAGAATAAPAGAEDAADGVTLESLQRRIEALEAERDARDEADEPGTPEAPAEPAGWVDAVASEWFRRVRLGGSADAGYFHGRRNSEFHHPRFEIWDARFFVDAELGEEVRLFDVPLVGNAGFSFEWNLVRIGELENDVGDLYVDLQQLGGSRWANLQVGRFQIPVGEAYLLYGKGYAERPFVTNVISGPWWWDEGLRAHGADRSGRFGYVASVTNGETPFNDGTNSDMQYTLKLFVDPVEGLHLSASGLYNDGMGSSGQRALGAVWLGEAFAMPVGSGTSVPTFDHGESIPPAPNQIRESWLAGGDVIWTPIEGVRLWLGYAYYDVLADGPSRYDRALHSWVAELVVGAGLLHPELRDLYVGFRAAGLGTYDDDEGYLLDVRQSGTLGFNAKHYHAWSAVLGWRMLRHLTFRAEYTRQDIDLVDGVPRSIRSRARELDFFAIELGAHF